MTSHVFLAIFDLLRYLPRPILSRSIFGAILDPPTGPILISDVINGRFHLDLLKFPFNLRSLLKKCFANTFKSLLKKCFAEKSPFLPCQHEKNYPNLNFNQ